MKNNIILSIIIPVYNSSLYLERCLGSIADQLTNSCEVIIVDDGSSDNSKEIYDKYSRKYKQILNFYKINGGVSSARNFGLLKANGKYITFVDSDDYVSNDFIEKIFKEIKSNIDIIFFQYNSDDVNSNLNINNDNIYDINIDQIIKSTFTSREPFKNLTYNFRAVWSKIIKKKIIDDNKITFSENISFGEDMLFMLKIYSNVKTKKFNSAILYHNFFLHEMSATNKYKPEMCLVIKNQEEAISNWINDYHLQKYSNYHALYRLNDIILIIKYDFFNKNNIEKDCEKKIRFKQFIKSGNYEYYYKIVRKNKLLHYFKKSKIIIILLAINNYYLLVKLIAKIKYR